MVVTIHQPDFLPWLGFFDRWKKSDLFIVLDDVQFLRRGWHHRDRIKSANGPIWLTVPVRKKGNYHQCVRDVRIEYESDWREKHLRTLEWNYGKAPRYEQCISRMRDIYEKKHEFLIDLNMDLLQFAATDLGIATPLVFASRYGVTSSSTQRLVDLMKCAGGTHYLTGTGSKAYLDELMFKREHMEVLWHAYEHPVYHQLHGEFIPMLSCLDYLMMRTEDAERYG